jgi:hypothetical protein
MEQWDWRRELKERKREEERMRDVESTRRKHNSEGHKGRMQRTSFNTCKKTTFTRGTKVLHFCPIQEMTLPQRGEAKYPTRSNQCTNHNSLGTLPKLPLKQRNRRKTQDSLAIFQLDLNFAEREVHCAATTPQGFPNSEWRHIFKGEAINLNAILSNLHHIAPSKENVGHISGTEISLGKTDPVEGCLFGGLH